MIVVDTSVWIDHLNDTPTRQVLQLRHIIVNRLALLIVGDLVLCEVLQGLASARDAALVEAVLQRFTLVSMVTPALAVEAAGNYRVLRARGVTVRKTIDVLIGTFCIAEGYALLHSDRDFEPMARYLGLSVVPV